MIYLFCGDDNFKSRQVFNVWIKKYPKISRLKTSNINKQDFNVLNQGLFDSNIKKALVIESLFSIKSKTLKTFIQELLQVQADNDVLIWENKKITPAKVKLLGKNCQAFTFKIPADIFYFLDSFGNPNKNIVLKKLSLSLKTNPPELIMYLLGKRLRDMVVAKTNPDLVGMAPWQKSKILNQVKNLGLEQIEQMYLKLIDIDYKNKTGQLGNSLMNVLINFSAE